MAGALWCVALLHLTGCSHVADRELGGGIYDSPARPPVIDSRRSSHAAFGRPPPAKDVMATGRQRPSLIGRGFSDSVREDPHTGDDRRTILAGFGL